MKRAALWMAVMWTAARVAPVFAQAPDFSGTWKLDPNRSRIAAAAALAGLIRTGAPETLHITHAANGTVIIESQINESQSRLYTPGGRTSTPVVPSGSITMTSTWDGGRLVSEGRQESASGQSSIVREVKELFALSADGRTLTIEVTTTGPDDKSASTLTYTKITAVEPCQNWPTPCKPPPR
jgi:hypothetical protein